MEKDIEAQKGQTTVDYGHEIHGVDPPASIHSTDAAGRPKLIRSATPPASARPSARPSTSSRPSQGTENDAALQDEEIGLFDFAEELRSGPKGPGEPWFMDMTRLRRVHFLYLNRELALVRKNLGTPESIT